MVKVCDRSSGWQRLQDFVRNHTHNERLPELVVERGTAPDVILSSAQARQTDVIVMGTHGRRDFDRLVLGSTTDRVMRRAGCPVMVIPPQDSMVAGDDLHYVRHLSRILFCADFSDNSAWALKYAISVAAEYDAELTLLHVLEPHSLRDKVEDAVSRAMEQLDQLIAPEAGRTSLEIKKAVRIGNAARNVCS